MGYLNSLAIAAAPLNLDEKLNWHRFDFDKVIPDEMVALWGQAIRLYDFGMLETTLIELPAGITYKGSNKSTVGNLITEYNLEYFTLAFAAEVPCSPLDVPLQCDRQTQRA